MHLLTALLLLATALGAPAAAPRPARLQGTAFDQSFELEARDLPASVADDAPRKAWERIRALERLTDVGGSARGGIALLNAAAGKAAVPVDADLYALLARAASFCEWSGNVHGPLGGRLNALWGIGGRIDAMPVPADLAAATDAAACAGLTLDAKARTARLAAGARADLRGFAIGFAIDRAVDVLRGAGAATGWVRIGGTERAFGPGPSGRGWQFEIAPVLGQREPERVYLLDRALAVRRSDDARLGVGGEHWSPYLDQRHGRPGAAGVLLAAACTDLAVDAEAVAVTMFAAGNRDGQSLLGALQPTPAVLWMLGLGYGPPLRAETRWSQIRAR